MVRSMSRHWPSPNGSRAANGPHELDPIWHVVLCQASSSQSPLAEGPHWVYQAPAAASRHHVVAYKLGVTELVRLQHRLHVESIAFMPKACRHSDAGEKIYKESSLQQLRTLIDEISKVQLLQDYGASNDFWKMNCDA